MYENLKGKKLLVMDRTALAACAVRRAKELGIRTIVANFYPEALSPSKQIADEKVDIDISDIDAMVKLVRERHVDGIFVGWTDSHLPFYAQICERAGLPCCGTVEQFDILSNDKRKFKEACRQYGVPTPTEYKVGIDFDRAVLDTIEYPVMVKPADGSGGRGIMRCDNEEQMIAHYKKLYDASASKKIVVERYIESPNEIFIHYTVQDGECSLSSAFMKFKTQAETDKAASCLFHTFAPEFMAKYKYKETVEPAVINMIKGLGLRYGNVMFQGFEDNGKFYFHESGLRPGGDQFYVFTEKLTGLSSLNLLIEFALTGRMDSCRAADLDDYRYSQYCCNYYVPLKPGRIASVSGIEAVNAMPEVLQNVQFKFPGDVISDTSSLDRVIFRIHVMAKTKEDFANALCRVSRTLEILDENGNEMQLEKLTYDGIMKMAEETWG